MRDRLPPSALLLACALAAFPAQASHRDGPPFDPDPEAGLLRDAAFKCSQSIDRMAGMAMEAQQWEVLSGLVAEGISSGSRAARSGEGLALKSAASLAEIKERAEGKESEPGLQRKLDAASPPIRDQRERWKKARKEADDLRSKIPPKEPRLRELHERALGFLDRADIALAAAESGLEGMGEDRSRAAQAYRRAGDAIAEFGKAVAELGVRAKALGERGAQLRERIHALPQEPQSVSRSRALAAVDPARTETRELFFQTDVALHRIDDFVMRRRDFFKAFKSFESARSALGASVEETKGFLGHAEELLRQVRDGLKTLEAPKKAP